MPFQPGSSIRLTKWVPGLLQGMDGVGKVEVSLATGVVSLEVIAEDPMDAAFVQVSQRAAVLLLVSGSELLYEPQVCCQCVQWHERQVSEGEGSAPRHTPVYH